MSRFSCQKSFPRFGTLRSVHLVLVQHCWPIGQTNTIGKRSQCRWNDEYIVFVPKHRTQIQIFCHCSVWGFSRVCGGRRASDRSRYNWLTIRRPRGSLGNSPTRHVVCFNCLSFPIWTKAWSTSSRQEPRTIKRFYSGISAVGRSWPDEQSKELVIKDKGGGRTEKETIFANFS